MTKSYSTSTPGKHLENGRPRSEENHASPRSATVGENRASSRSANRLIARCGRPGLPPEKTTPRPHRIGCGEACSSTKYAFLTQSSLSFSQDQDQLVSINTNVFYHFSWRRLLTSCPYTPPAERPACPHGRTPQTSPAPAGGIHNRVTAQTTMLPPTVGRHRCRRRTSRDRKPPRHCTTPHCPSRRHRRRRRTARYTGCHLRRRTAQAGPSKVSELLILIALLSES